MASEKPAKPHSGCHPMEWVAWGALALAVTVIGLRSFVCPHRNSVYPIYAQAARDWLAGASLYGLHPDQPDLYRYTPSTAVLMVPFGFLSDNWGNLLWRLV